MTHSHDNERRVGIRELAEVVIKPGRMQLKAAKRQCGMAN
jgi:hypothetical protein